MVFDRFSEDINTQSLVLETPEKEEDIPFDPKRDVTREMLEAAETDLRASMEIKEWPSFFTLAAELAVVKPELVPEWPLSEEDWEKLKKDESFMGQDFWLIDLKMSYPDKWKEIMKEIIPARTNLDRLFNIHVADVTDPKIMEFFVRDLAYLQILYPARVKDVDTEGVFEQITNVFRFNPDDIGYLPLVADLRLAFPEKKEKIAKMVDKSIIAKRLFSGDMRKIRVAYLLTIIYAEEISITDEEMKINFRKGREKFKAPVLPKPEIRRF